MFKTLSDMLIFYKTILWMEFWMSLEIFDIKKKVDFLLKWKLCTVKKEGEICKCKSFSFLWREASERSFVVIKMSCFSSDFSFEACVKRGRSSGMAFSTTVERKVTPCIFGAQSRDITMTVKWSSLGASWMRSQICMKRGRKPIAGTYVVQSNCNFEVTLTFFLIV